MNKDIQFIRIAELAAISSYEMVGKKNKNLIDELAVKKMRFLLNGLFAKSFIKVGEGTLDEAPMLYLNEVLGAKESKYSFDIIVDPIEGTNNAAYNREFSGTILALARKNTVKQIPDMYMEKLFAKEAYKEHLDLAKGLDFNLSQMKTIKKKQLKGMILNKPRHQDVIKHMHSLNIEISLIDDGDVLASILVVDQEVDFVYGIGGAPEGASMAALAIATNSFFQGRLYPYQKVWGNDEHNEQELIELKKLNLNYEKIFNTNDLISDKKVRFICTFLTKTSLYEGIKIKDNYYYTTTFFASHGIHRIIKSKQNLKILQKLKPNLFN